MKLIYFILMLTAIQATTSILTYACTCVRNNKWTLRDELNAVSLAVKGKVISVTDYTDSEFAWPQKLVRLVIEHRYKSPINIPDTVSIITGQDGATCGYGFKVAKAYIVYATNWKPKSSAKKAAEASQACSIPVSVR